MELGIALAAETTGGSELVQQAQAAEQAGFRTVAVSDHFHPWTNRQGQSPMVWPVLGAIAATTSELRFGPAVTCPILRTHPVVVAHAAATVASMADGRFFLGVGTGENLNEHVTGDPWPSPKVRLERLAEAIDVMRQLWSGDKCSFRGRYYTIDRARLFTLPQNQPPIWMSAFGPKAIQMAAEVSDGYVGTSPSKETISRFDELAGRQLPKLAFDKVCWGGDEQECRKVVHEMWPLSGLKGQLSQELATMELFEQAVEPLSEDDVVGSTPCGPDVAKYVELLRSYEDAGYSILCLHQIGPDYAGFLRFCRDELLPAWGSERAA